MSDFRPDVCVGIDPDTKTTALVAVDKVGDVVYAALARADGRYAEDRVEEMNDAIRLKICDLMCDHVKVDKTVAFAVESQAVRPSDPRPNDILNLAIVAGMAYTQASFEQDWQGASVAFPLPFQWKGTIKKEHHQKAVLASLSPENLAVLQRAAGRTRSKLTHLLDGYALALWLREKTKFGKLLPY